MARRRSAVEKPSRSGNGRPEAAAPADRDGDIALYRQMVLIRRFEDAVQALFLKGEIYGTTHLYSGQEACSVGVAAALEDGDQVAATYRGHGAALALGTPPQALMDELCGRATGICGGRAGSMNVVDTAHGLIGCFGIVGATMGAALGAALGFRMSGTPKVGLAFFGDGATNQGYFHECLNFAQVERLPMIFFCENNLYMEYTSTATVTAGKIADRPRAYGVPTETIDGNDVWTVRAAAARAVERARAGEGPSFIEAETYRLVGHSRSDPAKYRKPGELDEWRLREPLIVARRELQERHGLGEEDLDRVDADVAAEIDAVCDNAVKAPWPDPAEPVPEFAT